MRRILLATVAVVAISQPAFAVIPVEDVPSLVQQVKDYAMQVQQWGQQLQGMQQQLQQAQQIYYAMSHVDNIGSAMGALSALGIQNPLPVNPYAVQGLINGNGNAAGMLGSLPGLFTNTGNTNRVYTAPGTDWNSQELNRNASGLAGVQALGLQLYQSAAQRMPVLAELQADLAASVNPADRQQLANRIAAAQTDIQNEQLQATNLATVAAAQVQSSQQRQNEKLQQDADAILAEARANGDWP
jgi:type IV secretion system protein VirB5